MSAPGNMPTVDKAVDIEGFPGQDFAPIWTRPRRSRRRLVIASMLAFMIPSFFLTVDTGYRPLGWFSLPATRPRETSMCDYYAQRIHFFNSAATQKYLVATIIDKAFVGAKHPERLPRGSWYNGILHPGEYMDLPVDLTRYFDGSANTTNVNGVASKVSFLTGKTFEQDGREHPAGNCRFHQMQKGMNQYFAALLGCSRYGNTVDRYSGRSMKEIHKFMNLEGSLDWAYFIHQFQLGTLAAGFSEYDAGVFAMYLIDMFGPKVDAVTKEVRPCFDSMPLLSPNSLFPPPLNEESVNARAEEIALSIFSGRAAADPISNGDRQNVRRDVKPDIVRRQSAAASTPPPLLSTPPPLTSAVLAPSQTAEPPQPTTESGETSRNILPVALGAGIGAGLGVMIIGVVLAYFVVRKKRIERRKSMPLMALKSGLEMQSTDKPPPVASRRVDRSEHGNVVGKPKDSPPAQGHKKHDSVGVRSVRFSQHEAE
ncbi:hypothetical protein ABW21_db0207751 [Orbilia brochopaga]|nr:hypothetical protein ABW21_db0207751 [Drechslerella brochopaga]